MLLTESSSRHANAYLFISWRIKKTLDGYATTYLYDGDHIIAEYDGNNNLVRKYVYGPRVDEPVCMIDLADSNAVYYYHFDGLGSVVALTDANGTCVQTYEYSVYGHVAASDPNNPNPFMFTGRTDSGRSVSRRLGKLQAAKQYQSNLGAMYLAA
jgi:uncharacterized protein RhaS with RHS repeats